MGIERLPIPLQLPLPAVHNSLHFKNSCATMVCKTGPSKKTINPPPSAVPGDQCPAWRQGRERGAAEEVGDVGCPRCGG